MCDSCDSCGSRDAGMRIEVEKKNCRPKFRLVVGQIRASPPAVLCNTTKRIPQTASQHVQEKARDAPLIRLQSKPHTQDVYSRSHHRIPCPDHHRI